MALSVMALAAASEFAMAIRPKGLRAATHGERSGGNSSSMNADHNSKQTNFQFYKSEISFLIKEDKFSQNFSIYTVSDGIKVRFELQRKRITIFQLMTTYPPCLSNNTHARPGGAADYAPHRDRQLAR